MNLTTALNSVPEERPARPQLGRRLRQPLRVDLLAQPLELAGVGEAVDGRLEGGKVDGGAGKVIGRGHREEGLDGVDVSSHLSVMGNEFQVPV